MDVDPPTSSAQETEVSTAMNHNDGQSSPTPQVNDEGVAPPDSPAAPAAPCSPAPVASTRGRGSGGRATNFRGRGRAGRGRGASNTGPSGDDKTTPTGAITPTMSDSHTSELDFIVRSRASSSRPAGGAPAALSVATSESRESTKMSVAETKEFLAPIQVPETELVVPGCRKTKHPQIVPLDSRMDINTILSPSPFSLSEAAGSSPGSVAAVHGSPLEDPERDAAATLGKHSRAEPDLVEQADSRPTTFQKLQHEPSHDAPTGRSEAVVPMARFDRGLDQVRDFVENQAKYHRSVRTSEEFLTMEVSALKQRIRKLEKEKEEALEAQRRQLRPGLVTMKMTPRVQQRANQLFGSAGNGAGPSTGAPAAGSQAAKSVYRGAPAKQSPPEDSDFKAVHQGFKKLSTATLPTATLPNRQIPTKADPSVLPPMGFFRHPVARMDPNTCSTTASNNMASSSKASSNKASRNRASSSKASSSRASNGHKSRPSLRMAVVDDDSKDESDVPTESSYCSSIPP